MMRFVLSILCFSFLLMAPARAGDFAFEQVIGFSKDGRYFGFEEFGWRDGSGFPYSNVFIIDLETDTFAEGTPVRLEKREEGSLAATRWEVKTNARSVLRRYKLNYPAVTVHAQGLGDFAGTDEGLSAPITTRVSIPNFGDPTQKVSNYFDLVLSHIPAPSVEQCPIDTIGFQLEKVDPNGKRRFINRDTKILKSRGCPYRYRISRVYIPSSHNGDYAAVLLSVFQAGFEGPDRRFIVFPVRYK